MQWTKSSSLELFSEGNHLYSETWRLPFVFLEKPFYEVCLIRIKEHAVEKITVCTHGNADCLLKNTSIKLNKYEHVDDITFRELSGKSRVIVIRCIPSHLFAILFMKQSWTNYSNLSLSFELGLLCTGLRSQIFRIWAYLKKVIPETRRGYNYICNTNMGTLTSIQTTRYHNIYQSCLLWLSLNILSRNLSMIW